MKSIILLLVIFSSMRLFGQDDLLNMLDSVATPATDYTSATFKSTRIITGQSIESMKQGQLEFRVSHRFGRLNSGADQLFGIDQSTICLDLEYGLFDRLALGIGRTPNEKTYNGFAKLRLLTQSSGMTNMPVTISYFASIALNSSKWLYPQRTDFLTSRMTFCHQLLIARKFTDEFSLQLSPTLVHRNIVPTKLDDNDLFAMGLGARYKVSNRVSINVEYYYVLRPTWNITTDKRNPISLGVDIETGGHVFQIMLSNSSGMIEKHYIADTEGDLTKGDIHLGFNISRVFTLFGN